MHRTLSFRGLERLCMGLRYGQAHNRYQHEQIKSSNEFLSKVVKPKEEMEVTSAIPTAGRFEETVKPEQKIEGFTSGTAKRTAGEECWKSFYDKYENKNISLRDVVKLFRGVYAEAQYKKFQETPSAVYTVSCCGLFPMASIGLFSLVTGGALPGLAYAQLTYSASILSFLGGVSWGHSISNKHFTFEKLGWAVAPPLLGWSAIMLPLPIGFGIAAAGLTTSMIHDILLTSYPQWFKSLRYVLTVIALISFLPTFFMSALRF